MSDLEISVGTSKEGFAALRPEWEQCLERAGEASVFVTWEWLYPWWTHYGRPGALRLVLARRGGRLVGILPLHVQPVPVALGRTAGQLTFVGRGGDAAPDYLGPVIDDEHAAEVLPALCRAAARDLEWDVAELTDMAADSAFPSHMERACREQGLLARRHHQGRIPILRLPASWDEYLAALSGSRRKRLRRARRRVEAAGGRLFTVRSGAGLNPLLDRLTELQRQRWGDRALDHPSSSSRYVDFHRTAMHACAERDRLRLYGLEIGGEVVAIEYCYRYRDEIASYQGGFDPRHADLRPGVVVTSWAIEDAIAEGMSVYDLLKGEHDYKNDWASDTRSIECLHAYRRHPRSLLLAFRREVLAPIRRRGSSW